MENNKQQTAVEWLAKSYVDLLTKLNNDEISLKEFEIQYIKLLEQAKEMEKERLKQTYLKGWHRDIGNRDEDFEQYYEQTYGGNK